LFNVKRAIFQLCHGEIKIESVSVYTWARETIIYLVFLEKMLLVGKTTNVK